MKLLVVVALVAVAAAAPQQRPQQRVQQRAQQRPQQAPQQAPQRQNVNLGAVIELLRYISENDGLGSYNYAYEQSDGRRQEEQGELKNAGAENESIAVKGSYAWVGPDGVTYEVNYIADDNGFQPTIQQGPGGGVPEAIVTHLLNG